jgi:hypothetical protein
MGCVHDRQRDVLVSVIPEPVPKDIQAKYVKAAQDLQWLADRGHLDEVAKTMGNIRAIYDTET